MALIQPQLPRPQPIQQGSKWADIWGGFGTVSKQDASLRQYLQNYLTRVYQWLVPAKFQTTLVTGADLQGGVYSVAKTDTVIVMQASGTVQLPLASGSGRTVIVKALVVPVSVLGQQTDTIDGAAFVPIAAAYDVVRLIDGAQMQWLTW